MKKEKDEGSQPKTELPSKPHRFVAGLMASDNARAAEAKRNGWGPAEKHADTEIGRRILNLHNAILLGGEAHGYSAEIPKDKNPFGFVIDGQKVSWRIREGYKRRQVPLDAKELKDPWNVSVGRTTRNTDVGTGSLIVFLTARYASDIRLEDKPGRPLSVRIDEIIDRMKASATYAAQREEEDNLAWRNRLERQDAARRQAKLVEREEARWALLRQASSDRSEVDRLRATVALVREKTAGIGQPRLKAWLEWAEKRIDALDVFSADGNAIFYRLVAKPGTQLVEDDELGEDF